jgi:hypothetical protein
MYIPIHRLHVALFSCICEKQTRHYNKISYLIKKNGEDGTDIRFLAPFLFFVTCVFFLAFSCRCFIAGVAKCRLFYYCKKISAIINKTVRPNSNDFLFRKLFVEEFLRFRHLRRRNLCRRSPLTRRNPFYSLKITSNPIKFNQYARTKLYFTPCMYSKEAINMHVFYLFQILQKYIDLPAVPQEVRSPPVVFALS